MKAYERNIRLYYWYVLCREPVLWGSILITYIRSVSKMSLSEVYLMEASCVILAVILQIPTGTYADRHGRTSAIKVGMMFIVAEMLIFSMTSSRLGIWISNASWAIGSSFLLGADSALLFDSLVALGREDEYRKIEGRAMSIRFASVAVAVVFSGHLASVNIRLPCILDTILVMVCFIMVFFFAEAPHSKDASKKERIIGSAFHHMKTSLKLALGNRKILWIISCATIISVTSKLWFFTYNPYFEKTDIPIVYFGYIFAALNIVAGISSRYADRIARKLSVIGSALLSLACVVVPILVMGTAMAPWAVIMVIPQNFTRGFSGPFIGLLMNQNVDSENRATMLSVKSAFHQGTEVVCMVAFSAIIKAFTLSAALIFLGIVSLVSSIVLLWSYKKVFSKS